MPTFRASCWPALAVSLLIAQPLLADGKKPDAEKAPAQAVRVPYQLTDTKHILVRARINGKGPFHFILDTGAPTLFVSKESAKKHGLTAAKNGQAEFERLEIEGGAVLEKVQARVETPFQVSGMNAMGLPGVRLDGMLGYTVLAQFRIELDLTKRHMLWTKLDWSPPAPAGLGDGGQPPEVAVMGGLVSFLQLLIKKKPEPVFVARGFLGIELADRKEGGVVINAVLDDSPAAKAGLKPGDRLLKFQDKGVRRLAELHPIVTEHAGKDQLELEIDRDGKLLKVTVTPGRGL